MIWWRVPRGIFMADKAEQMSGKCAAGGGAAIRQSVSLGQQPERPPSATYSAIS